eukprot:2119148-Pyramimonas_sp.AAC.1
MVSLYTIVGCVIYEGYAIYGVDDKWVSTNFRSRNVGCWLLNYYEATPVKKNSQSNQTIDIMQYVASSVRSQCAMVAAQFDTVTYANLVDNLKLSSTTHIETSSSMVVRGSCSATGRRAQLAEPMAQSRCAL